MGSAQSCANRFTDSGRNEVLYYLSVEGLIILENAVHMGLPVQEKLSEVLERRHQNRINDD